MRLVAPRSLSAVVLTALALGLLGGFVPRTSPPADAVGWSPLVDEPSGYDGQTTCTRTPQPGTVALSRYLLRTYKATRSMGTIRACGRGGQSEHKDGRAFDWGADVRRKATRRAAYDFLRRALATDAAGNRHALARRMGVMYVIYNDTIWSSYRDFAPRPYLSSGCRTKKRCSRTLRHLDHVHISLGRAGAAAQTSWYRSRGVASRPVLYPGTQQLDPDLTAVAGLTVPATGARTASPFVLRAGITYRVVATGTVRDRDGVGDAACTRPAGASAFEPASHGLLVEGGLRWEGGCRADHTYEAWFTPLVNQRLPLAYVGGPATGSFTVYVARDDITLGSLARR